MGRIRILPEAVANKIAAGEVVERPASVVKELIENSLDAGAERIRVEVEAGGKRRIHVVDDGSGMGRDDAMLAFERHATSKLRSADDLLSIATMGFRGEALPSIAAVSRLTLETRSREEPSGTRIEFAGGRLLNVQESGLPAGTAVTVSDLFYNVPARRKFLRAEATELSHITTLLTHCALAYPEKSFLLDTNSGALIQVTPVGALRERVFQLFGAELLEDLVEFGPRTAEVPRPAPGADDSASDDPAATVAFSLSGFVSRPQVQKLNRNSLYLFVNRRQIRDRVLLHAIQEAFRNILPPQCFPVAMLFLEMPGEEVDVNVHPAKTEVRFRHQGFVHDFVRDSLRESLAISRPISTFPAGASVAPDAPKDAAFAAPQPARREAASWPTEFSLTGPLAPPRPLAFDAALGITEEDVARVAEPGAVAQLPTEAPAPDSASELAQLQPLGQIRDSFIVASSPSGLWLIDQHVAHERVLFERFLAKREQGAVETQRLLMPYILRLSPTQRALWDQIADELAASGFEAEPFGQGTIAVKAVPAGVKGEDIEKLLAELVESLEKESRALSPERVREKIAASVACHAAIKINTPLEQRKMEWLLAALAATRLPMSCPHGRPIVLKYGMREILKAFHRI
ncbi:MAG: DNA mismatch repair protein MutL [Acidobacteria bacterium RIFCSPLOWO2_02_FULL_61_28]|nr:MAG: DNA mismatch repair protein MutL [Acidobacteria bacterium RIFCSPLOWO2_02_FULL_61_28]